MICNLMHFFFKKWYVLFSITVISGCYSKSVFTYNVDGTVQELKTRYYLRHSEKKEKGRICSPSGKLIEKGHVRIRLGCWPVVTEESIVKYDTISGHWIEKTKIRQVNYKDK